MRKILFALIPLVALSAPSYAGFVPVKHGGYVCNTEKALDTFEREWKRQALPESRSNIRKVARGVGSWRDWCIPGYVKLSRRITPAHSPDVILALDLMSVATIIGLPAPLNGFIASRFKAHAAQLERVYTYRTVRGQRMFFSSTPAWRLNSTRLRELSK